MFSSFTCMSLAPFPALACPSFCVPAIRMGIGRKEENAGYLSILSLLVLHSTFRPNDSCVGGSSWNCYLILPCSCTRSCLRASRLHCVQFGAALCCVKNIRKCQGFTSPVFGLVCLVCLAITKLVVDFNVVQASRFLSRWT
jgi:hypothetical protein